MKKVLMGVMGSLLLASMTVQAEEYLYDELNRVTKVIYEDGSYVEYVYDKNGNILNTNVYDAQRTEEGKDDGQGDESQNDQDQDPSKEPSQETGENTNPDEKEETDKPDDSTGSETSIVEEIFSYIRNFVDSIMNWFRSIFG